MANECRWEWTKPDKPGLWWYGGMIAIQPETAGELIAIQKTDSWLMYCRWWAYIGPIPPEPLPPKRKVTQTLWMVPAGWAGEHGGRVCYEHWLSTDDTIPPGAIETVQKREVEQ